MALRLYNIVKRVRTIMKYDVIVPMCLPATNTQVTRYTSYNRCPLGHKSVRMRVCNDDDDDNSHKDFW